MKENINLPPIIYELGLNNGEIKLYKKLVDICGSLRWCEMRTSDLSDLCEIDIKTFRKNRKRLQESFTNLANRPLIMVFRQFDPNRKKPNITFICPLPSNTQCVVRLEEVKA